MKSAWRALVRGALFFVAAILVPRAAAAVFVLEEDDPREFASVDDGSAGGMGSLDDAFFSTVEAELEHIYGAQNFPAGSFINISFDPVRTAAGILSVEDRTELLAVLDLRSGPSLIANFIFIETVDWCGAFSTRVAACSSESRGATAFEREIAASAMGTELLAHELGHLLGLRHIESEPNLMNGRLNGNTSLTPEQVATINDSPLVQGLTPNRFIRITPVLVVPEPSAFAGLFLAALLFTIRRRP